MNLSLCLESSDPTACVYTVAIFRNTLLPKKPCSMNLDFINPSKFICVLFNKYSCV